MDKNISYEGSCSCGAVKYFINDYPLFTHACHCKDCKKSTGSAFVIHTMTLENTFLIDGDIEAATLPTGSGASYKPYFCKKVVASDFVLKPLNKDIQSSGFAVAPPNTNAPFAPLEVIDGNLFCNS